MRHAYHFETHND